MKMTKTIIKMTPQGEKTVTLDYGSRKASLEYLPFRRVFWGEIGNFKGCCFRETGLIPGKEIIITLPNAPSDFVKFFKPIQKEQPKIDYSRLGAGFKDDEMETGKKQALKNLGLGNPFIPQSDEPNTWRVAHRDS